MQTLDEYLAKTKSAVRHLFDAIDAYRSVLDGAHAPIFISSTVDEHEREKELQAWVARHGDAIQAAREAEHRYFDESFALATICGAVLQVADKAFECFSSQAAIPADWEGVVKEHSACYCSGRFVRKVPLGLIVLGGRNQHMHFDDEKPRQLTVAVFDRLAIHHGRNTNPEIRDPAFDLRNDRLVSYAHNVVALLKWESYERYEADLRQAITPAADT